MTVDLPREASPAGRAAEGNTPAPRTHRVGRIKPVQKDAEVVEPAELPSLTSGHTDELPRSIVAKRPRGRPRKILQPFELRESLAQDEKESSSRGGEVRTAGKSVRFASRGGDARTAKEASRSTGRGGDVRSAKRSTLPSAEDQSVLNKADGEITHREGQSVLNKADGEIAHREGQSVLNKADGEIAHRAERVPLRDSDPSDMWAPPHMATRGYASSSRRQPVEAARPELQDQSICQVVCATFGPINQLHNYNMYSVLQTTMTSTEEPMDDRRDVLPTYEDVEADQLTREGTGTVSQEAGYPGAQGTGGAGSQEPGHPTDDRVTDSEQRMEIPEAIVPPGQTSEAGTLPPNANADGARDKNKAHRAETPTTELAGKMTRTHLSRTDKPEAVANLPGKRKKPKVVGAGGQETDRSPIHRSALDIIQLPSGTSSEKPAKQPSKKQLAKEKRKAAAAEKRAMRAAKKREKKKGADEHGTGEDVTSRTRSHMPSEVKDEQEVITIDDEVDEQHGSCPTSDLPDASDAIGVKQETSTDGNRDGNAADTVAPGQANPMEVEESDRPAACGERVG